MGRCHSPVVPFPWSFHSFCEGASDHHSVRSTSESLANVASLAHSAVCNDRDAVTGLFVKIVSSRSAIHCGCYLRHPQTEDAARGAGGSRTDADQNPGDPAFENFEGDIITDRIADDDWAMHLRTEFFQVQRLIFGGNVPDGRDSALDEKDIHPGLLRDPAISFRFLRDRAYRGNHARILDLLNARCYQIFLHRFLVDFLKQPSH